MGVKFAAWSCLLGALFCASAGVAEPKSLKALALDLTPSVVFGETNPGASTQTFRDGVVVTTAAGARVDKAPSTSLLLSAGTKTTPTHVLRLSGGRVDIAIPEAQISKVAVLIIGPRGVSGVVKGGRAVAQALNGTVSYTALDHEMLIGKGSRWRALDPGHTRIVDLKRGGSKDALMPSAPELKVKNPLSIALADSGFATEVSVEPMKNAARYQFALLKRDAAKLSVVSKTTTSRPHSVLKAVRPGQYVVVARALDERGIAGEPSPPQLVRAMGVGLPKGAQVTNTTVLLRPSQRLPLVAAEGLKMTYGGGSYFVDAPDSIGLLRESPTTVRFIEPSSKAEAKLSLTPNITRAKVAIGPRAARWPQDRVRVKVRLQDGSGRAIRPPKNLNLDVSVNLQPVKLEWQLSGDTLTGSVPQPKDVQGPWVVRVEVSNELGELIGRDFLEIAADSSTRKSATAGSIARR